MNEGSGLRLVSMSMLAVTGDAHALHGTRATPFWTPTSRTGLAWWASFKKKAVCFCRGSEEHAVSLTQVNFQTLGKQRKMQRRCLDHLLPRNRRY